MFDSRKVVKKSILIPICLVMCLVLSFAAVAGVYFSKQARMTLFSGSIEQPNVKPGDPKLILKVAGQDVGQDGYVADYNSAVFPILTNVEGKFSGAELASVDWKDENGRQPISAQKFVVSAKNGSLQDVEFKIVVQGNDSIVSALRFGIVTKYYSETDKGDVARAQTVSIDSGRTESELVEVGDGNILQDEEVEVSVVAWVDSYALSEIGEYDDMGFNVNIVFVAP